MFRNYATHRSQNLLRFFYHDMSDVKNSFEWGGYYCYMRKKTWHPGSKRAWVPLSLAAKYAMIKQQNTYDNPFDFDQFTKRRQP